MHQLLNDKNRSQAITQATLSKSELDFIQQVYLPENRYIKSAFCNNNIISFTLSVDSMLGIKRALSYAPASTISAIVSQCGAICLWFKLCSLCNDVEMTYNKLVENELVGFKSEKIRYQNHLPLQLLTEGTININRYFSLNKILCSSVSIEVQPYFNGHVLAYAYLGEPFFDSI